ncbi:uncharacterized protein LOC115157379 [Salmo trutta]|uniref:uncharacterized protein LOC115157379 n=1 Tax=Salmo trutta TaxID=8032 RepID=UPI00112FDBAA|nr:uncharacterized protein LOC115157379 [Salmo trutta]
MSGRERSRNRTWSLDSDLDSRASQTVGSSAGGLEEDKEVASQAVLFFINGSRRGAVHLCSSIAEILRENQRLHRTVEVQRVRIEELMCSLSTAPAAPVGLSDSNRSQTSSTSPFSCLPSISLAASSPYLLSPPASVSPSVSSLYSSGRGSLCSNTTPPCLPPLVPLHNLTPQRRPAAVLPCVKEYEKEDPGDERRGKERGKKRGGERRQEDNSLILPSVEEALGSQPLPIMPHSSHSDSIARERVRREKGNLSSEQGGQTSDRKHTLKKREKVLRRSASCGPLRGEMEETKEEERWCLAPDCPDSSSTVQAAGGLDTRALTTRRKHRLCVNDRVVLESRTRGEERRRGAVRFIGPLENTESRDIYIGVELDTASGENEGSLHGNRYFRCKPNHGTFTTITGIRKLSRSSHSKSRSSKPPDEGDSSDSGPGSSAVAMGRSSRNVGSRSRNGLRRTWNQMDIRPQVHSEPGPRDKTTVENPGLD